LANPDLGAKQICPNCQAKFYDLSRRPAVCPKCATAFDPEEAVKSRRMRARSTVPDYETDDEKPPQVRGKDADADGEGFEEEPDETPEIDQAAEESTVETDEEEGEGPAPSAGDDLGVDFAEDEAEAEAEEDDTVPFLEDEDDDFVDEEIEGIAEDDGDER
jgi:uncharacterized protein (TIGR02300 family)